MKKSVLREARGHHPAKETGETNSMVLDLKLMPSTQSYAFPICGESNAAGKPETS